MFQNEQRHRRFRRRREACVYQKSKFPAFSIGNNPNIPKGAEASLFRKKRTPRRSQRNGDPCARKGAEAPSFPKERNLTNPQRGKKPSIAKVEETRAFTIAWRPQHSKKGRGSVIPEGAKAPELPNGHNPWRS